MFMTSCNHNVLPLMQRLPGAIFLQDNARAFTSRESQDCLHTVTTLPWPTRSLDLSSIEHISDHLGKASWVSYEFERTGGKLQQIWNERSQDIIHNLYV
ncbi:transposable element Tcb2 transposase [Trichonephila clavipes]|nr:transposable element Tcb2 transposase [Trichonephila clavipes]